jgi:glycosyltransferase involved in cell wall biosynthesis
VRIGVIVPAFNAARWIAAAVASVLAQTHRDWRMVVVDDGSTDGTAEVVAGFGDPRIRLIGQANAGVSAARNAGIAALIGCTRSATNSLSRAAGEGWGGGVALLFLDADDWLAPDALARLATTLEAAPDAVAAGGAYAFVDTGVVRAPPFGDILQRLLVRNLFANGGHLLLRGEAVRKAGCFLPGIAYGEDWEFWIRIALQGPFAVVHGRAPVLFVRRHTGGAYHRFATDPAAFAPCMDAIFGNPVLCARFGAARLVAIRRRTEAENHWIIGRELIRHESGVEGRAWLRRSVRASPSPVRAALLAAAHVLPLLPPGLRGPFRSYRVREQATLH